MERETKIELTESTVAAVRALTEAVEKTLGDAKLSDINIEMDEIIAIPVPETFLTSGYLTTYQARKVYILFYVIGRSAIFYGTINLFKGKSAGGWKPVAVMFSIGSTKDYYFVLDENGNLEPVSSEKYHEVKDMFNLFCDLKETKPKIDCFLNKYAKS